MDSIRVVPMALPPADSPGEITQIPPHQVEESQQLEPHGEESITPRPGVPDPPYNMEQARKARSKHHLHDHKLLNNVNVK